MSEQAKAAKVPGALPSHAIYVGRGWSGRTAQPGQDARSGDNWNMSELPSDTKTVYLVLTGGQGGFDVKVDRSMASDPKIASGIAPVPSTNPGDRTASFAFNSSYRKNYYCATPMGVPNTGVGFDIYITKS